MSNVYLARQPIVCIEEKLEAYEILYVDAHKKSDISKNRYASASVINSVLNKFGTRDFLSEHKAFIKVDERFLMSDLIKTIPTDFFTLSLFDDIELTEKVIERIEQLYALGFSLGISDTDLSKENILRYEIFMDKLSYFKINIYADMGLEDKDLIVELQDHRIQVVATKIEDRYQYETAKDLECDLYQGYWFAKPQILENEKFDPTQFNVLKLYNMLLHDTSIDEIASEFERNHALSLQLIQFINSAHFSFNNRISSIHHILTLVGRKPLSQWLMLMIYSKSVSPSKNVSPLMLMVQNRTQLMQNLLKVLKPSVRSNALGEAYLVGVLSLVGSIFKARLEDVLEHIHVSELSRDALLYDKGTLGMLYKTVRDIEEFNVAEIVAFSKRYKVAEKEIQDVILLSIENVNNLERDLNGS
ncbi:EAL and HDOD domain-containing protein [Sulfurimonas sp.]|uniref:EAL and HDOD domain-containing protein n=1 Tax=Sulfurimonas sp. TaxID=2022749 RepID=UPI0039E55793